MGEINIPVITFLSVLGVNPNKTQQRWTGSQLWNVLELCCKYWNYIFLAVLPGCHYEVLVSLMLQGLWTQIKISENFDMHICKKSSVHCNAVLALPCTSEDPHVFQNLEAVKKPKTHLRKKGKCMCITLLQRMLQLLVCGISNGQDFQQPLSCFLHLQLMPKYLIFLML